MKPAASGSKQKGSTGTGRKPTKKSKNESTTGANAPAQEQKRSIPKTVAEIFDEAPLSAAQLSQMSEVEIKIITQLRRCHGAESCNSFYSPLLRACHALAELFLQLYPCPCPECDSSKASSSLKSEITSGSLHTMAQELDCFQEEIMEAMETHGSDQLEATTFGAVLVLLTS
ncbi:hypothetical protein CF326_g9439 [Tilletia indica]|nr:hypothetical protein CF326_g9439 [Tilletia indica]